MPSGLSGCLRRNCESVPKVLTAFQAENVAKKQALKKRKASAEKAEEPGPGKKKARMWWEDELDGQRMSARDGPAENAAYYREEVCTGLDSNVYHCMVCT